MLTDEERIAFDKSIAGVRHLAAKSLAQASDAGQAIEFVANLHRSIDSVALHASEVGPTPDCQLGCSYCCYIRVEATDPEIFRIVRRIRQRPEAEVADLSERLRRHATGRSVAGGDARQCCAFLVGAQCTIYEVRPATCRKAHSLSVRQCETLSAEIPQNLKLLVAADAMMAGTAEAYRGRKLHAEAHELNAAVLAALNDQAAEARWYNGDDVFRCSGQLAPD